MRWGRLPIAVAIALTAVLGFAATAHACSCARTAPGKAMRQADAAIVGELVRVVPRGRRLADYRYRVRRVYKGGRGMRRRARAGRAVLSVRSARGPAACGLPGRAGRRYGLLLTRGKGRWWGGRCGVFAPRRMRSLSNLNCVV